MFVFPSGWCDFEWSPKRLVCRVHPCNTSSDTDSQCCPRVRRPFPCSVKTWAREDVGWAGLGWAGLGWAGLGWAGLGWGGVGWGERVRKTAPHLWSGQRKHKGNPSCVGIQKKINARRSKAHSAAQATQRQALVDQASAGIPKTTQRLSRGNSKPFVLRVYPKHKI